MNRIVKSLFSAGVVSAVAVLTPGFQAAALGGPADDVAGLLAGNWATSTPVSQMDGEDTANIVMHVAPVEIDGIEHAMYVETARADAPWEPYRQAVFSLYTKRGKLQLRTYEFRSAQQALGVLGTWAAPQFFPAMTRDDFIATQDVELSGSGSKWSGKTAYPYPTGVGGAVEMTTEVTLGADTLTTADRGYGADGSIVWGAGKDGQYTFTRTSDMGVTVDAQDSGLTIVEWAAGEGDEVGEGDTLTVNYSGYLTSGFQFDSSLKPGREPFRFQWPGRFVQGWNDGLKGVHKDTRRRVFIPSALGYADRGAPQAGIGPDETLVFDVHVLHIQHVDAQPGVDAEEDASGEVDPHAGHDHD